MTESQTPYAIDATPSTNGWNTTQTHPATPGDVAQLRCWFSVIRQLRQIGKSRGLSIVTLKVLVDEDGNPIQWGRPRQVELSPLSNGVRFRELLVQLCQDNPDAAARMLDALG